MGSTSALKTVATPLRLTLIGLWAERLVLAFWPLWTLCLAVLPVLGFGLLDGLPLETAWLALLGFLALVGFAIWYAARHFQRPTAAQALARLDATLAGQPLAALVDDQAINAGDPDSVAVWAAHLARMQGRLVAVRAVAPDLRLSDADPFALRYLALLGAVLALGFGSMDHLSRLTREPAPLGPSWEAWATPPAYTGKPALYLNEQPAGALTLPVGTRLQTRLYGAVGDMLLDETVSGRTVPVAASEPAQDFTVTRSGDLAITGRGGRVWAVTALADTPPSITADAKIERKADGHFQQVFTLGDDYGVVKGSVTIALDLALVDRRYGLAVAPDGVDPVTLDLALPRRGVQGSLVDDLSQSILSNMPVTMIYTVADAAGQLGHSAPVSVVLPGRRFFDPLAAALAEMRRDILWSRANAPRAVQILKAVTNAPEGFIRNQAAYLRLRVALKRLDANAADLTPALRDEIATELWDIALLVEEGDLQSAKERLDRAQDRLNEAIKNGASDAEIADLMAEMRRALKEYTKQLGAEADKRGQEQTSQNGPSISQDQLQQMLDKLQKLMEQGKTAEAADLMEQLRQFLDNMQVAQGGTGEGSGTPSDQAMKDLGDTLRGQQKLSDDAFRDLQDGQSGQGQDSEGGKSLAQRQQELRDKLDGLRGDLPGAGTDPGESGRQALDDAGRAMEGAEQALREGDMSGALDQQAQALESLRNGIGDLNDAQAAEQAQNSTGDEGSQDPDGRDPLGRQTGKALRNGSDENLLQGQDVYRRADELLGEIRRRAGELARPDTERSYLKRLLDLF